MKNAYLITAALIDTYRDSDVGCLEKLIFLADVDGVRDAFVRVKEAFRQQITEHFNEDIYIEDISDGSFNFDDFGEVLDALFTHDDADLVKMFQLIANPTRQSHNLQLEFNATPTVAFTPSDMTGFVDAIIKPRYSGICLLETENPDDGFTYINSRSGYIKGEFWV